MRLFIAINLPAAERRRIHRASAELRKADLPVRWVEPEAYHVTLKFLGEVPPEKVDTLRETIATIAAKTARFPLAIGGFGAFPSLRRPRVIWLGVHALPELRALKHDLEWELASLGFERELRAFHPHVTLGRTNGESRAGDFRDLEALVGELEFSAEVQPTTVDLMQSRLTPSGPVYSVLARMPLAQLSGAGK